jgi:hypothetical protein
MTTLVCSSDDQFQGPWYKLSHRALPVRLTLADDINGEFVAEVWFGEARTPSPNLRWTASSINGVVETTILLKGHFEC